MVEFFNMLITNINLVFGKKLAVFLFEVVPSIYTYKKRFLFFFSPNCLALATWAFLTMLITKMDLDLDTNLLV